MSCHLPLLSHLSLSQGIGQCVSTPYVALVRMRCVVDGLLVRWPASQLIAADGAARAYKSLDEAKACFRWDREISFMQSKF